MRQLRITKSFTNRTDSSLGIYLGEIGKINDGRIISPEEEASLGYRIRHGDNNAVHELVRANLRFVVTVAKKYQHRGLSLSDLIEEGNLGLVIAAEKFNETRGFKFASFAVWWIRAYILYAINTQSRIFHLPNNRVEIIDKVKKASARFEQENERTPSLEELSELLEMPEEKIEKALSISGRYSSIDAPFVEGENFSLNDVLWDDLLPRADTILIHKSLQAEINDLLKDVKERNAEIVKMFFGINYSPMSNLQIGNHFGLKKDTVKNIKKAVIENLRESPKIRELSTYL
ncbi:RNA polymerase sigma factor RpoD/SigA [Candidatus Nomurabacteria bacterium]|nr:RNA polymerase sigma factor RpoD/SigA [Candidatus Nomurabacteria bacterium]